MFTIYAIFIFKKMNSPNKNQKHKHNVTFNEVAIIYFFLDSEDRKSYWVQDRCHFQRHCYNVQKIISFIFEDSHRLKIRNLIQHWDSIDPTHN